MVKSGGEIKKKQTKKTFVKELVWEQLPVPCVSACGTHL